MFLLILLINITKITKNKIRTGICFYFDKIIKINIFVSLMDFLREMRRVVVTGMGIWSCIGTGPEEVRASLYAGKSGIGLEPERLAYGFQSALTGIVPRPEMKGLLDRHLRRGLSEEAEYAYMASAQALQMAGLDEAYLAENEAGCIFGNDSSAKPVIETDRLMQEKHDTELLGQSYIFQ